VSKRGRNLTADEKKLWRKVAENVKPRCKASTAVEIEAHQTTPQSLARRAAVQAAKPPPATPKRVPAPPQNRSAEKRVRRGKLEIGGSLDLHGHTQESGYGAVIRFLQRAHVRGDSTVIIVTGIGRYGEGVLKRRLPEWLNDSEVRSLVAGFAPAHRAHGGAGAFYVFLKRSRATHD
jgi:DNA-nicking Smr family endonuclease